MRQVLSVCKPRRFPGWKQWQQIGTTLTKTEGRFLLAAFAFLILSLGSFFGIALFSRRIEIPTQGGEYTEALIGEPQLINPMYTTTNDVDQDLVSLIYSGLLKWDPKGGLVSDLAESFEMNEEATAFHFTINKNAKFHNGDPVLARDVLFTISAIQNPAYRSPLLPLFRSVSLVQEDDRKISFILEKPQPTFLKQLTVGILPANAWAEILPQNAPLASLNLQPIGSGPYKFEEFTKDKKGSIRSYTLSSFADSLSTEAYIRRLTFKFYPDAPSALDALNDKFVEGVSVIPFDQRDEVGQNRNVVLSSPPVSREVTLFFNQKTNETLKQKSVREAIALAIDKNKIVATTLEGRARVIAGPLLPGSSGFDEKLVGGVVDLEKAKNLLAEEEKKRLTKTSEENAKKEKKGSEQEKTDEDKDSELTKKTNVFTLTTIDSEEFRRVAEEIKNELALIGLEIEPIYKPAQSFFDEVITPRNFELLLATTTFNSDPDPYVFWHSTQTPGAGLNIVDYQNAEVDKLLDEARTTKDDEARAVAYRTFQEKLLADVPAIFLYQSTYEYAISKKVQNVKLEQLRVPSDRFADIETWYVKTKKVFK